MTDFMILEGTSPTRKEIENAMKEAQALRSQVAWQGMQALKGGLVKLFSLKLFASSRSQLAPSS